MIYVSLPILCVPPLKFNSLRNVRKMPQKPKEGHLSLRQHLRKAFKQKYFEFEHELLFQRIIPQPFKIPGYM